MKKPVIAVAVALAALTTSGCGVIMRYIGEAAAAAITQKTSDLSALAVNASYTSNLFPRSTNMVEVDGAGDVWQDGQSVLTVVLVKRQGIGLYEVDGSVGYKSAPNGPVTPMTYVGKGSYIAPIAKTDTGTKTIVIRAGGQTAEFKVGPTKPITIRAINGKPAAGATIDLSRDLVLDLANPPGTLGSTIKVSLGIQAMGIRTMSDLGNFKAVERLVIPKAAFRNMLVSASQDVGLVGIEKGENLLLVERYAATWPSGTRVGAAQVVSKAWGWAPVKVTGDAPLNPSLAVNGKTAGTTSDVVYMISKPNAFYGPPLLPGRQFALGSLRARGTLFKQTSSSSSTEANGWRYTTTTTTTLAFPTLPEAYWQAMLGDLEQGLRASFQRASGTALLPMDRLNASATYRAMEDIEAQAANNPNFKGGTSTYVVKPYRGSKYVFPESFGGLLGSVSSTFAHDRPVSRVLAESRLDGVMAANLDVQIATLKGSEKLVLVPAFSFALYGPPNGYVAGPTVYGGGTITMADGVPFNTEALQSDPAELSRVVRMPELLAAFEQALRELRAKEQAEGYDAIWKLR